MERNYSPKNSKKVLWSKAGSCCSYLESPITSEKVLPEFSSAEWEMKEMKGN